MPPNGGGVYKIQTGPSFRFHTHRLLLRRRRRRRRLIRRPWPTLLGPRSPSPAIPDQRGGIRYRLHFPRKLPPFFIVSVAFVGFALPIRSAHFLAFMVLFYWIMLRRARWVCAFVFLFFVLVLGCVFTCMWSCLSGVGVLKLVWCVWSVGVILCMWSCLCGWVMLECDYVWVCWVIYVWYLNRLSCLTLIFIFSFI